MMKGHFAETSRRQPLQRSMPAIYLHTRFPASRLKIGQRSFERRTP